MLCEVNKHSCKVQRMLPVIKNTISWVERHNVETAFLAKLNKMALILCVVYNILILLR